MYLFPGKSLLRIATLTSLSTVVLTQCGVMRECSSVQFANALRSGGVDARLLIYPHAYHLDFVLDWLRLPLARCGLADVDRNDAIRRKRALTAAYGEEAARLVEERISAPNVPHARDLWRIVRAAVDDKSVTI